MRDRWRAVLLFLAGCLAFCGGGVFLFRGHSAIEVGQDVGPANSIEPAQALPELLGSRVPSPPAAPQSSLFRGSAMTPTASSTGDAFTVAFADGGAAGGVWVRLVAISESAPANRVQLAAGRAGNDGRLSLSIAQARAFSQSTGSSRHWTYALVADVLAAHEVMHQLQDVPASGEVVSFPLYSFQWLEMSLSWSDGSDVEESAWVIGRTIDPSPRSLSSDNAKGGLYKLPVALGDGDAIEVRASTLSGSGCSPWVSVMAPDTRSTLRLILARNLICRGSLLDESAQPIGDAALAATLEFSDGTMAPSGRDVATDKSGEFRFYLGDTPSRSLKRVHLRVQAPGGGEVAVDAPRADAGVIELGRLTVVPAVQPREMLLVEGFVQGPQGRALRHAIFQITEPDGAAVQSLADYDASTGRFSIRGRTSAATLGLSVRSAGFQPYLSNCSTGSRGVRVELAEGFTIVGRVLLDDATLATSLILQVTSNGRVLTSIDLNPWRFELPGLPPSPVEVRILLRPLGWVLWGQSMTPSEPRGDLVIDLRGSITVVSITLAGVPKADFSKLDPILVGNGQRRALLGVDDTGRVTFSVARLDGSVILVLREGDERTIRFERDELFHAETIDASR